MPPERGEILPSQAQNENLEDAKLLKEALSEIERYRSMDRLIPSPHNIVTIAALEVSLFLPPNVTLTSSTPCSFVSSSAWPTSYLVIRVSSSP